MNKTKIEWADMTWNPLTGCLNGCKYCYARKIARRFSGYDYLGEIVVERPAVELFHKYRLDEPQRIKKPQNIFVCSMADLFGEWVPDEWIEAVFEACQKAPQHRYIFLTKNYRRYNELREKGILPLDKNMYFGVSVENEKSLKQACLFWQNIDFLSIEPLSDYLGFDEWSIDSDLKYHWKWVIVGAETGNRKGKIIPKREWIEDIYYICRRNKCPLFMKNSLYDIWMTKLTQEFPWEAK